MTPYNIEIFHPDFTLVQHYTVGAVVYSFDYLSIEENSIVIPYDANVKQGDYIYLRGDVDYFGVVSSISVDNVELGYSEIRYKPFTSLFNEKVIFDTDLQGSGTSLEDALKAIITDYFVSNADTAQNISGLTISTISTTSAWGFNLKSDVEGLHKTLINLYETLLVRSMTKYRVGLYATPNLQTQTITLEIGVKTVASQTIEADLPNVIERAINIKETDLSINKLTVYNAANYTQNEIFYRHPDGTYDTTDSDRITPVVYEIKTVKMQSGETFADAAADVAKDVFKKDTYNNLIELTVRNDDDLVMPSGFTIGQEVTIISNGTAYTSLFTGMSRGETTKLVFGTIRLDLTKILKGVLQNG